MLLRFFAAIICTVCLLLGIGNWWVQRAITWPTHPQEWYAQIEERRNYLQDTYHAQSITLKTCDKRSIASYWIERENAPHAIVMCHGHHMVKENMIKFLDLFPHDSILMFDFRGHGNSTGESTTLGIDEQYDVLAALDFIQEKVGKYTPLFGFAFSMGGLSLIKVATYDNRLCGLILDSAFSSLEIILAQAFARESSMPFCPTSFMYPLFKYFASIDITQGNSARLISTVRIPVLIIHAENDEITPISHAYNLYAHAQEPKQLWLVKDAKHGYIIRNYFDDYKQRVAAFCSLYSHCHV